MCKAHWSIITKFTTIAHALARAGSNKNKSLTEKKLKNYKKILVVSPSFEYTYAIKSCVSQVLVALTITNYFRRFFLFIPFYIAHLISSW